MIDIQTVIVCKRIDNITGGVGDFYRAAVYDIFPTDGKFPFRGQLPLYLLLRKDSIEAEIPFTIRMELLDLDARPVPRNEAVKMSATFPAGFLFWGIFTTWKFYLPKIGRYHIRFSDKKGNEILYEYHFTCSFQT